MTGNTQILRILIQHPRLDAAAAPAFRDEMTGTFANRPERVLIDLGQVEFIDSTGLGVLVSLMKQMGPGGRIAVVGANAAVRRLFQITRLDTLFVICDTEEQADAILG